MQSYEIMDELVACRLLRGDLHALLPPAHSANISGSTTAASPAGPAQAASADQHSEQQPAQQVKQRKGEIDEDEGEEGATGSSSSVWRAELAERLARNITDSGRLLGAL
jgi:hypothetical protein